MVVVTSSFECLWRPVLDEEGQVSGYQAVVAWRVRPEGEDLTSVWDVRCVQKALLARQKISLVEPILKDEIGGWDYEAFRKQGCQHCKRWRDEAVILRLVRHPDQDLWRVEDGAGRTLVGLQGVNPVTCPIRVPKDLMAMTLDEATIIRLVIRVGECQPVFRRV